MNIAYKQIVGNESMEYIYKVESRIIFSFNTVDCPTYSEFTIALYVNNFVSVFVHLAVMPYKQRVKDTAISIHETLSQEYGIRGWDISTTMYIGLGHDNNQYLLHFSQQDDDVTRYKLVHGITLYRKFVRFGPVDISPEEARAQCKKKGMEIPRYDSWHT